jgi:hypothetical protein
VPAFVRPAAACLAVAAALLASGCSPPSDQFAPACPQLKLLPDGADITRFTPRGQDVTDEVMAAHITAVPASCKAGKKGFVQAALHVSMTVERGHALVGQTAAVPYFVTIMKGDNVLERKSYGINVGFPVNQDQVNVDTPDIDMLFPVEPGKTAQEYTIYVSFQLTPQELEYNRRNPPR